MEQTDRQTDTLIAILRTPPGGEVITILSHNVSTPVDYLEDRERRLVHLFPTT